MRPSQDLIRFIDESNSIEGIRRSATTLEIAALQEFLMKEKITVTALKNFVSVYQPGAKLRDREGLDVYVGDHHPLAGNPNMKDHVERILDDVEKEEHPYLVHVAYETLHPFTDGNGRSGRALWAWQMTRQNHAYGVGLRRGFLHEWYYQSLQHSHIR